MTVFLSYSRRDARFATELADALLVAGFQISPFDFFELLDDAYDFIRESKFCFVLYSERTVLTDAVRLANRLRREKARSFVMQDERWEPDAQARLAFREFEVQRLMFDVDVAWKRISTLIRRLDVPPDEEPDSRLASPVVQNAHGGKPDENFGNGGIIRVPSPPRRLSPEVDLPSPQKSTASPRPLRQIIQSIPRDDVKPASQGRRPTLRDIHRPIGK